MIRAKAEQAEDLDIVFPQYFGNQQGALIAVWVLANEEMTLDTVVRYISSFRNAQKRKEFESKIFDYTPYRLRTFEGNPDETREMEVGPQQGFISRFKEEFGGNLDRLGQPTKHLLQTGIQGELNSLLFNLKQESLGNGEKIFAEPKTEYLKRLIETIVEKFSRDNQEGVSDKIIDYGGIEPVLTTSLFSSDLAFKNKFKTILFNCKTFIELKRYGGKDITEQRNKLIQSISKCLIRLRFDQSTAQEICDELLEKPLSNIVALRDDLTNKQKESYYSSEFYRNGELKAYAQILDYENSLENKVKEDVAKILKDIEDLAKNSKDTIENVLSFNFYNLLKINTIRHIKKNIYQNIISSCPAFLKAFKQVKYQGKSPASLKENERINQKMELINLFFKIKLPFEEWDRAENKILSRDYKVVQDLTLRYESKYKLMQHIFDKVEPYFHRQEKEMDYKQEVEHALLRQLIDTEIGDNVNMDVILNIIAETLDLETEGSETILQAGRGQQRAYNEALRKCQEYQTYKANMGRDIKEEEYQKSWQLKKQIYEINLQDRIDVAYDAITTFIDKIIKNGGTIPDSYPIYITNLSKLKGELIIEEQEEEVEEKVVEIKSKFSGKGDSSPLKKSNINKEDLQKQFNTLSERIVNTYISKIEDSIFEKHYNEKFGKDSSKFVSKLIETSAFMEKSTLFNELGLNNYLTKKMKTELASNLPFISADLEECSNILQKLNAGGGSAVKESSISSSVSSSAVKVNTAQLEEEFRSIVTSFVQDYAKNNQDSLLQKMLNQKYGSDIVKYIKTIIDQKAFEDQNSAFFTGLALNNYLAKRIKAEFQTNGASSLVSLKRAIEIAAILK